LDQGLVFQIMSKLWDPYHIQSLQPRV